MSFQAFLQDNNNMILFVAALALLGFLLYTEFQVFRSRGSTLTPVLLTQSVNAGAKLIDLRRPDDFRDGHIAGARNIQPNDLKNHIAGLGEKDDPIVLYCYRGSFSAKAVRQLKKAGFTNVAHLSGGINVWLQENLPLNKA